jgi:hypothetical protein
MKCALEEDSPIVGINRLAVARRLGLTEVVTADRSFAGAEGIIVYQPGDISGG